MTDKELAEYNKNRKIFQIGIAVNNLEEAMQRWTDIYRIGPWRVSRLSHDTIPDLIINKGAVAPDVSYRMATTMVGNIQFELMEANDTTPIYSEHIARCGEGLHHFKEKVPDSEMDGVLERFNEAGMPVLYGGHYYNASFYYIDTPAQLEGVLVELGNCETLVKNDD